jgi:type I restriction enzyme S subunit
MSNHNLKQDNTISNKDIMEHKTQLINVFKQCLNILRDNEGLTGEKALRNLSYLLILKLLEPHIGNEIDIYNHNYHFDNYFVDHLVEHNKEKLFKIMKFSNLAIAANEEEDNLPVLLKYLWEIILSNHPSTKNIFLPEKNFDIQYTSTYKKLITKLATFNLMNTEYDVLGNAYEEVIQDIMTGKVLGQFFTQPLVKKMMVRLIDPQIHEDGTIDTCGDPTMGTGGFLITYLQYILQQACNKNIKPNWEFIKNEGIYGKELEPDTYQLAVSNMLISSGHMFDKLERGDSIREPIKRKFDNILANPPFGIKGLKYDDFQNMLKDVYTPIKTNNAVSLFIQAIIYMLNMNGKCAVVLPHGQDLFSKTNKTLIAIREYLMKTCDLKEIYYLPSGIFTYTSIKTCIFYFVKKREGSDVLTVDVTYSKTTQKETKRKHIFSNELQTKNVVFYEYDPYEDKKTLLVDVPIEKIVENSYSLNYSEYITHETNEDYKEGVVVKTLGEVCKFLPKSKRKASYGKKEGKYPFFKSSIKINSYVDEPDYQEESLIIGTGGNANIKYCRKFSCSSDNLVIKINTEQLTKYIYYYMLLNIEVLQNGFIGVGLQHISKQYIKNIKIPFPPLETQKNIVEYFDFIYEKANKSSYEKIKELKQLNKYSLTMQKILGDNIVKTLGDITTYKSGKRLPKGHSLQTNQPKYPYIRITDMYNNSISLNNIKYISQETKDIIQKYVITTDDIYITIAGTTGLVGIIPDELNGANLTENAVRINIIDKNEILQKYLVYEIQYNQQKEIQTKTIGTAIPKLSIQRLMTLKISIPPLETQKNIVEYCEYNDNLIKQLEQQIERNKKQAKQYMDCIIYNDVKNEE